MAIDPALALENEAFSLQHEMNEAMARGDSEIQRFYRGLTVFVTGGTGFIGKQLIEKLLRSCDIKKVFMLIRTKKGVEPQERLRNVLSDPVFDQLRKRKPDFEDRVVAVAGDLSALGLGIRVEDRSVLTEEVEVIFHAAATIRFDEALSLAAIINVRGTRDALTLAKACRKLKSFIHVSTAYTHTTSARVGGAVLEQFYPSPMSPQVMIDLAEKMDPDMIVAMSKNLIKHWPNTYTFTKALAEELVRTESAGLPVAIVRPSIVIAAYAEPTPGWLDASCVFGPTGIVLGAGIGVIRVLYLDNQKKLSFVPVDYVNNATIAAGWDVAVRAGQGIPIYTVSSTNCGVTFRHISVPMRDKGPAIQTNLAIWYCYLVETKSRLMYWILSMLLHYIPAYTVDAAIKVAAIQTPKEMKSFVKVYEKIDRLSQVFEFFLSHEWLFDETNLTGLWQRLSEADRRIYNFQIDTVDFSLLTLLWCVGVRKYILKDGLNDTVKGIKNRKWFKMANYAVIFTYICIGLWIVSLLKKLLW